MLKSSSRRNSVAEVAEQAMLAKDVYTPYVGDATSTGGTPGWKDISMDAEALAAFNLSPADLDADSKSGFRARAYLSSDGGGMPPQVVFCGSKDLSDLKANLLQGVGLRSEHHERAIAVARKLGDADVQFVGHSLGGGLASVAAMVSGREATTFNAAGVHQRTLRRISSEGDLHDAGGITAVGRANELLGAAQRHVAFMAEAVGHSVSIASEDGAGRKPGLRQRLARHGMGPLAHDLSTAAESGSTSTLTSNENRSRWTSPFDDQPASSMRVAARPGIDSTAIDTVDSNAPPSTPA